MLDDSGFSKGFGFIRFGNEQEQQTAMTSMMGVSGLGGKPIKVGEIKFDTYLTTQEPYLKMFLLGVHCCSENQDGRQFHGYPSTLGAACSTVSHWR